MENAVERQQRDIGVVTTEIKEICAQAQRMLLVYAVEIGRRLVEAKEILPYGEWGEWLQNEVNFSQSTANKYMQLYKKFGSTQLSIFGAELKSETFTNLSYSQALKLLVVPDDEVEEFVEKNNVSEMSTRDLGKLIKERDEALKKAESAAEFERKMNEAEAKLQAAEEERRTYDETVKGLNEKLDKAKKDVKKYKELAKNPDVPQEKVDEITKEVMAKADETKAQEIEKAIADIKGKLDAAEDGRRNAETMAENAKAEIENLKKQLLLSDPAVTEFKAQFNTIQLTFKRLEDAYEKIKDDTLKDKFKSAVDALLNKYREEFNII